MVQPLVGGQAAQRHQVGRFELCPGQGRVGVGEVVLCSHSFDKGKLVKVLGGSGECINPTPKPAAAAANANANPSRRRRMVDVIGLSSRN